MSWELFQTRAWIFLILIPIPLTTGSPVAWWGRCARPGSAYTAPLNSSSCWPGSRWSDAGAASISRLSSATSCLSPHPRTGLQSKHKYKKGYHYSTNPSNCLPQSELHSQKMVKMVNLFLTVTWLFLLGLATVLKEMKICLTFPRIFSQPFFFISLSTDI